MKVSDFLIALRNHETVEWDGTYCPSCQIFNPNGENFAEAPDGTTCENCGEGTLKNVLLITDG